MYADLHLHSVYSDGTDTPLELIELAQQNNVRVISITDHDSVAAYKILSNEKIPEDIELIPGIEISVEIDHNMVHILGYYINIYDKGLENLLTKMSAEKNESTRLNFERAVSNDIFSYDWDRVLELNSTRPRISGIHVVKAMETDGYNIPGMDLWDIFYKYFWPTDKNYICASTVSTYEAIEVIKSAGGISVIAHPYCLGDDNIVFDLISHGIQGLEVYHPEHSEEINLKYLNIAQKENLYISGGSDWHGKNLDLKRPFASTGLADKNYKILNLNQNR